MKPTRAQQAAIRAHWPWYTLRFMADGRVMAKHSRSDSPYALLYTIAQTASHIATLETLIKRQAG